jgi:hypothetical protein
MWRHVYTAETTLTPSALWPALADVASWPAIDTNIAELTLLDPPGPGARFRLRPRGGPPLRFTIGQFVPPSTYSDVCALPGATMTTEHRLEPIRTGTRIVVEITVQGWLRALWVRLAATRHAAGLPAQTARFIEAARMRTTSGVP